VDLSILCCDCQLSELLSVALYMAIVQCSHHIQLTVALAFIFLVYFLSFCLIMG